MIEKTVKHFWRLLKTIKTTKEEREVNSNSILATPEKMAKDKNKSAIEKAVLFKSCAAFKKKLPPCRCTCTWSSNLTNCNKLGHKKIWIKIANSMQEDKRFWKVTCVHEFFLLIPTANLANHGRIGCGD